MSNIQIRSEILTKLSFTTDVIEEIVTNEIVEVEKSLLKQIQEILDDNNWNGETSPRINNPEYERKIQNEIQFMVSRLETTIRMNLDRMEQSICSKI